MANTPNAELDKSAHKQLIFSYKTQNKWLLKLLLYWTTGGQYPSENEFLCSMIARFIDQIKIPESIIGDIIYRVKIDHLGIYQ